MKTDLKIIIRDDVPVPPSREGNPKPVRDAIRSLEVGQSFEVSNTAVKYSSLRCVVHQIGKSKGAKFITRSTKDAICVWRIS